MAVVGASRDPAKWGHVLARGALAAEHRRRVYLVNRRGGEVLGRRVYRAPSELPESPELAVVAVPAAGFAEAVDAALESGARAIVGISGGLGELGGHAALREAEVAERVRAAGAVLLGPNCLGVYDSSSELYLVWGTLPPGAIGVISQSGNLGLEIGALAGTVGLGVSRFASIGNQADIGAVELIDALREHDATQLIALYLEDFRDGRGFVRAARAATAAGKTVLLLAAGGTPAGARAARSHTGALVADRRVVEAACREAGVVLVSTPTELVDAAQAFVAPVRPQGRRIAVVGDGGGSTVIAADLLTEHGFELPVLSQPTAERLGVVLRAAALPANPVDLAGRGEEDVTVFGRVVRALAESREVETILLTGYFGAYGDAGELETAQVLADATTDERIALVVQSMHADSRAAHELRAAGVPVYRAIESAVLALARRQNPRPGASPQGRVEAHVRTLGYWEARDLVADAGVGVVQARSAVTLDDVRSAADALTYPVVLKALGRLHKSDGGGVVLGLRDERELIRACSALEARLAPAEYSVERMVPLEHGVELIVGVRRDPRFGPVVAVGFGGLYVEILDDVAVALAPVDERGAETLLRSLRGAPLLAGARGRPGVDVGAAARAVERLSRLALAYEELDELEVNPLFVDAAGAVALDARALLRRG